MKTNVQMNCPNCGSNIKVDELLVSQFQQSIKKDLETELLLRESELNQKRDEYKLLHQQLNKEKEDIDELVNSRVKSLVNSKEESLKESIRKEINDEKSLQLQELENELLKKSSQLKELNRTKAQLETLRREMEESETKIILEKEKELTERLEQARLSIKEQEQQANFLKLKEKEMLIESLKVKLDEARRKADQGSVQLQGESQEVFLEQTLKSLYVTDDIAEIGKGCFGADCIQTIRTKNGSVIGSIVYESKNTKHFSTEKFISKLKSDNLKIKADIMVIVTETMPKQITGKFGIIDGVWICHVYSIAELSLALRFGLLKLQQVAITQQGKASKMELLYAYLTSEEFKGVFESILEGFKEIQDSHNEEKLKIQRLWKQREKQLERVLSNSIELYGSIRGIAGSAIPELKLLEFHQAI